MDQFKIKFTSFASGSSGNCYLLEGFKTKIMLECGISEKRISEFLGHNFSQVDACLVSHQHKDHSMSMYNIAVRGIDIYSTEETLKSQKQHFRFNKIIRSKKKEIPEYKPFNIGEFLVKPFHVEHDVVNVGFQIDSMLSGERLVFIIDTYYSQFKFENVTHLCIECNYSEGVLQNRIENTLSTQHLERLWSSHFSLERVINFINENDFSSLKEVHLLHLSESNSNADLFKESVQKQTKSAVYVCGKRKDQ